MSLSKEQITNNVVKPAIEAIGDYPGDIANIDFSEFGDRTLYKSTFLQTIKLKLTRIEVTDRWGGSFPHQMYFVVISDEVFNGWNKVGDCINYLSQHVGVKEREQ